VGDLDLEGKGTHSEAGLSILGLENQGLGGKFGGFGVGLCYPGEDTVKRPGLRNQGLEEMCPGEFGASGGRKEAGELEIWDSWSLKVQFLTVITHCTWRLHPGFPVNLHRKGFGGTVEVKED
jgi:hypothetical protein